MGRIAVGIMSQDHVALAPHGRRLYRWRREVSTAKGGRCDLRRTAGSTNIIADVDAVVADPQFYQQGNAYFRGIWAQAGESPPGQHVLLQILAPHTNGLDQTILLQHSGLDSATCSAALAALSRHDVIVCQEGMCRYRVELMRRWVASGAATTEV